jgi:hypothetical protein
LLLIVVEARRGDYNRPGILDAMRNNRYGRVGNRKIDYDVGVRFADDAERYADFADSCYQPRVAAEQTIIGRFQRCDDLKPRVFHGQRRNALAHSAGSTMDGEFHDMW